MVATLGYQKLSQKDISLLFCCRLRIPSSKKNDFAYSERSSLQIT